jgi:pimeloyl-ACP methyl ester carboxylesterase
MNRLNKKGLLEIIYAVIVLSLLLVANLKSSVNLANALGSSCDTGLIMPSTSSNALPAILVRGYAEDSGVWSKWEPLLKHDRIPYCTASFQDDECGAAIDHANELKQIVQKVKILTHKNQVNIIGHSKGGLDARVYLAQSPTHDDIANLIMIGTPNAGGPLADFTVSSNIYNPLLYYPNRILCTPALLAW